MPESARIRPVLLSEYHKLTRNGRMVLFHPGAFGADGVRNPGLQGLVNLRAYLGRADWVINGVTHSLSGPPGSWFMFEALLEALRGHDALACTSEASRANCTGQVRYLTPWRDPSQRGSVSMW